MERIHGLVYEIDVHEQSIEVSALSGNSTINLRATPEQMEGLRDAKTLAEVDRRVNAISKSQNNR